MESNSNEFSFDSVKSFTFSLLNGELEEEIYVEQPLGYVQKEKEEKVYSIQKSLYGLKQASRFINNKIDSYF